MKDIYENIKSMRLLKSLSQEHVAECLGVSQSSYGKLERGTTRVTWEKLVKLAEILETTPWQIVNFNKERPFPISRPNSNIEVTEDMDEETVRDINQLQERVKYLEQVNDLLQKQLDDKREIIQLLKKELDSE